MNGKRLIIFAFVGLCFTACQKQTGKISIDFSFSVDTNLVMLDTCMYVNAAGNRYEISEIQFFISELVLQKADGTSVAITSDSSAHYVDLDLPHTLCWKPTDAIPEGEYTSVSFVFGLSPRWNKTSFYVNAPENNMSWPALLGGGYHYMKINGKWLNPSGVLVPFCLHTGRGSIYDEASTVSEYVENSFTVVLPLHHFVIQPHQTTSLGLLMNVNQWFDSPNIFDFNVFGGSIMQNQQAQELLKENGKNVFTIAD